MKNRSYFIKVPVEMITYSLEYGLLKELRLLIFLKLLFPEGKFRNDRELRHIIRFFAEIKSTKTIKKYFDVLFQQDWIRHNLKTDHIILVSFDKIRKVNHWKDKLAFPISLENEINIKAITGAVLYGLLYRNFCWRLKTERSVQVKECTYYSYQLGFKHFMAPVSVLAIKKKFNISIGYASKLKHKAKDYGLIKVKKKFKRIEEQIELESLYKEDKLSGNFVHFNGEFHDQQIDHICPNFHFRKRKTVKHIQGI